MLRTLLGSAAHEIGLTRLTLLVVTGLLISGSSLAQTADGSNGCSPIIGRIVSRQGTVEVQRPGQKQWTQVRRRDVPICQGDRIRVGPLGRALLMIGPEIIVRIDQNTTLTVTHTEKEVSVEMAPVAIAAGAETKDARSA